MNASSEQALLARLEGDDTLDLADILRLIVDWLRPTRAERGVAAVVANIETLVMALDEHPALRQRLAKRLEAELGSARHLALYTEIGLFSRRGFLREFRERLYERINPRPLTAATSRTCWPMCSIAATMCAGSSRCPTTRGGGCWRAC